MYGEADRADLAMQTAANHGDPFKRVQRFEGRMKRAFRRLYRQHGRLERGIAQFDEMPRRLILPLFPHYSHHEIVAAGSQIKLYSYGIQQDALANLCRAVERFVVDGLS